MDNGDTQHESNNNALQQNLHTACRMENISTTIQSLDTVRALHHTVVSLRSALEEAKFEIQRLRSQISTQSDIKEGIKYQNHNQIEQKTQPQKEVPQLPNRKSYIPKIAQPTKHLRFDLKNNNIKRDYDTKPSFICKDKNFNLRQRVFEKFEKPKFHLNLKETTEHTIQPANSNTKVSDLATTETYDNTSDFVDTPSTVCRSPQKRNYTIQKYTTSARSDSSGKSTGRRSKSPADITIITTPKYRSSDTNQPDCDKMASKIDVKIKVMSNIKVASDICEEQNNQQEQDQNDTDQAEPSTSRSGKEFNFSTEENLTVRQDKDGSYIISQSSKENLNLEEEEEDVSEGDNSVFEKSEKQDKSTEPQEPKEECDDIELIFSSDENRDPIQEEMISLSEYDPWKATGSSGTPVLVKFSSLPSDQDSPSLPSLDDDTNAGQMQTSSTFDEFSTKVNANLTQEKSIDSIESFDFANPTTKSISLERDNSDDQRRDSQRTIGRDESLDFFDNKDGSNDSDGMQRNHRKWTNYNILVETDISKCGIAEETNFELYQRRNTCPNPPAYRPMILREPPFVTRHIPSRLASRYSRRLQQCGNSNIGTGNTDNCHIANRILSSQDNKISCGPKRSSSAQTEISALPELWKSECHLAGNRYHIGGPCTLPSKFVPIMRKPCQKHHSGISERSSTEARRILLSDINFTSMVPELSRSADHLCQDENRQDELNKQHQHQQSGYYKGNLLKTPDYALKGITPSASMTSPGLSQWTVNENSFGTQTIQTGESWGGKRGDSLDSCRSYSIGSRTSGLDKHHRSRSVPSVRCAVCRQTRIGSGSGSGTAPGGIRTSESMHYTPRVAFQEPANKVRGSLPDLRHDCLCNRRYTGRTIITIHGESSGSTESLLEEADAFVRKSLENNNMKDDTIINPKRPNLRRMSENDIQKDYTPSKQSLPFLPKTAKCLKPGHLAKVITKNGRVVVGRVRYVGPLVSTKTEPIDENNASNKNTIPSSDKNIMSSSISTDDLFVGIQLQSKCGDCDGTFEGRKIFECEPLQGLFVPFKKVIMAWTS
ncbi:uncharacterized protein LOC129619284 isoform X2 [Condylostylus longicornis]|uniref:uncharacterized protein LOC129619284 isoform X2 n=1 Tax=Condylostylus longicornis TaxID=2530218 RepID=UPI00244DCD2C|nr:uncharacterized protein LOC129619284 isoform X2 [Condylostylus longicornis]